MKRKFTYLKLAACVAMSFIAQQASATFTPVAISSGFNQDIVANGIGIVTSSTTASYDNTAYSLVAPDYQQTSTSALPTNFLPANGVINSVNTSGVTFNLAPYTGNNSLKLITNNSSGTLTFTNNTYIGDVYLLCGGGDGSPTGNVVINFVGGTTQTFSNVTFNDWFNNTGFAIQGIGRVNRSSNALDAPNTINPRLYEMKLTLAMANYSKTIQSITVTKTTATGSIEVMAVNVDHQSCLPPQSPLASNITINSATLKWRTVAGSGGYEYAVSTSATPPASGTYTTDTFYNASGLPANTLHYLYVRNKCGTNSYSIWNSVSFTTLPCPTVTGLGALNITTVSATVKWNSVAATLGYQYAITTSSTPPASGTAITDTFYNATNLSVGTTYYLHVRSNCTGTSYSTWSTISFTTLPCPSAGSPTVSNNVPFSVTVSWPGSTTAGVAGYNYVVNTSSTAPTTSTPNIQFTASTTVNVNGLIPGTTYYAWVRTNCTATNAGWLSVQFINPFPPCNIPTNVTTSAVSMHGAKFKWNASTATSPMGYQYAISTSATPPASGTTIGDTTYTAVNLLGNTSYYFHLRTLCGNSQYSHYSTWVSTPFSTNATCLVPTGISITNVTASSASIKWDELAGIYGYEYFIDQTPASPTVAGTGINYNALAPLNLFSGTNYYFHLRVRCDTFTYSPWVTEAFTTQVICSAPTTPNVSNVGATGATFIWGSVSGASSYQYAITTASTPPVVGTPTSNTTYTASGILTPSTSYYFHVRAYCSPNDISQWKTVSFTTGPITDVGNVPSADKFAVNVYPNPVRDVLIVEVKPHGKPNGKIQVVDLSGKVITTIKTNNDKTEVNMSNLAPGMYLVRYFDDVNAQVIRVQKQ